MTPENEARLRTMAGQLAGRIEALAGLTPDERCDLRMLPCDMLQLADDEAGLEADAFEHREAGPLEALLGEGYAGPPGDGFAFLAFRMMMRNLDCLPAVDGQKALGRLTVALIDMAMAAAAPERQPALFMAMLDTFQEAMNESEAVKAHLLNGQCAGAATAGMVPGNRSVN